MGYRVFESVDEYMQYSDEREPYGPEIELPIVIDTEKDLSVYMLTVSDTYHNAITRFEHDCMVYCEGLKYHFDKIVMEEVDENMYLFLLDVPNFWKGGKA